MDKNKQKPEITMFEEIADHDGFRRFFKETMCEAIDKVLDEYSRLKYKKSGLLWGTHRS